MSGRIGHQGKICLTYDFTTFIIDIVFRLQLLLVKMTFKIQ